MLSSAARMGLFARRSSADALTFYTAGETPRAPRGHRAWCECVVVGTGMVLMGKRPCGRFLPSTTRRSTSAQMGADWALV